MNRCFTGAIAIAFMVAMAQPSIAQSGDGFFIDTNLGVGILDDRNDPAENRSIEYDPAFMGVANVGIISQDRYRLGVWLPFGGGEAEDIARSPVVKFDWVTVGIGGFGGLQYAATQNFTLYGDFGVGYLLWEREPINTGQMVEGKDYEVGFLVRSGVNYEFGEVEDAIRPFLGLYAGGILSADEDDIPHVFIAGITLGIRINRRPISTGANSSPLIAARFLREGDAGNRNKTGGIGQ